MQVREIDRKSHSMQILHLPPHGLIAVEIL